MRIKRLIAPTADLPRMSGNLLTQPDALENAAWDTVTSVIITANAAQAPDGSITADLIAPNSTSTNDHTLADTGLTTSAISYTARVRMKAFGYDYGCIRIGSTAGYASFTSVTFNLSTGNCVGVRGATYAPISCRVIPLVNYWYLCEVQLLTAANSTHRFDIRPTNSASDTSVYAGYGAFTNGIYAWGAEFAPTV